MEKVCIKEESIQLIENVFMGKGSGPVVLRKRSKRQFLLRVISRLLNEQVTEKNITEVLKTHLKTDQRVWVFLFHLNFRLFALTKSKKPWEKSVSNFVPILLEKF